MQLFSGLALLFIAAFLSCISGYVSILGMSALFPAGGVIVMAMMGCLELSKLFIVGWLHGNWANKALSFLHKSYLLAATIVLMALTSIGIFGFLSKSHLEQQAPVAGVELKIAQIEERVKEKQSDRQRLDDRLKQLDAQISTTLNVSKSIRDARTAQRLQATQKKEREQLQKDMSAADDEINKLNDSVVPLKLQMSDVSAKLGPIKYVASLFGWSDTERAVQLVILMIMFVFDPLAVVSVISAMFSFGQWGEKRAAKKALKEAQKAQGKLPAAPVGEMPMTDVNALLAPQPEALRLSTTEEAPRPTASIPSPTELACTRCGRTAEEAKASRCIRSPCPMDIIGQIDLPKADVPVSGTSLWEIVETALDAAPSPPSPDASVAGLATPEAPTFEEPIVEAPARQDTAAWATVPSDLKVSIQPTSQGASYGFVTPLRASVDLPSVSLDKDPTSHWQSISAGPAALKTESEHLLDLLAAHPEILEQVVQIVEADAKPQKSEREHLLDLLGAHPEILEQVVQIVEGEADSFVSSQKAHYETLPALTPTPQMPSAPELTVQKADPAPPPQPWFPEVK